MLKDLISAQGTKTLLDMGLGTTIEETIVRYVFQNPQDPSILDALEYAFNKNNDSYLLQDAEIILERNPHIVRRNNLGDKVQFAFKDDEQSQTAGLGLRGGWTCVGIV